MRLFGEKGFCLNEACLRGRDVLGRRTSSQFSPPQKQGRFAIHPEAKPLEMDFLRKNIFSFDIFSCRKIAKRKSSTVEQKKLN